MMHKDNYVYLCDPKKRKDCRKTSCQTECRYTKHEEASKDGKRYIYNAFTANFEEVKE